MGYQIFGWGGNSLGELGINTVLDVSSPLQIGTSADWTYLTGGISNCAGGIKSDNTLWLWGYNYGGVLGVGPNNVSSPTQILGGGSDWSHFSLGQDFGLGVKTNGSLWSWGNNSNGQFGNGTTVSNTSPENTNSGTNWNRIYAGSQSACGIKNDDSLWTWGYNVWGVIGDDTNVDKSSPVQIAGSWLTASTSVHFIGAIKKDGTLWMWGYNALGQLGNNSIDAVSSPIQVGTENTWRYVSCGESHTGAIKSDGSLWLWGNNPTGELADNTNENRSSPVQVYGGGSWLTVSCSQDGTVAIKNDGTVWCWGYNNTGTCGINSIVDTQISSPVQALLQGKWLSVASSQYSSFALGGSTSNTYEVHLTNNLIRNYNIATGKNIITEGSDGSLDGTLVNGNSSQRSAYLTYRNSNGEIKVIEAKDGETVDFTMEKFGGNNVVDSI